MTQDSSLSNLQDILGSILQNIPQEHKTEYIRIRAIWNKTVGQRIAEKAQPASVRKNILFVNVENSVWMQELHFLRDKIIEKINSELHSAKIEDIRFKVGSISPPVQRGLTHKLPALNSEEIQKIAQQSSSIEDPELRQAFERVMAAYMKNKKQE